jgi:hypothetical protein
MLSKYPRLPLPPRVGCPLPKGMGSTPIYAMHGPNLGGFRVYVSLCTYFSPLERGRRGRTHSFRKGKEGLPSGVGRLADVI